MTDGAGHPRSDVRRAGYRPELQGLRALAVVLVVVYHVWVGRVSGGVDVFFFVTGFLLTGQLVRAAERGTLDVRQRWSRTLLRLVPTAAVVLAATAVASAVLLPASRWAQTVREIGAAAVFVENWQLAADSVDYAAQNDMAGVVQHFWSLSIQGQVFLLWPLLIAVVALACRRAPGQLRRRATLALLGVFVVSLVYSVELTVTDQPLAYFHTLTRLWEFAAGGLFALHAHRIVPGLRARVAAGWAGVVGLVACGAVLPVSTVFPGVAALWPTGCAALVLLAGRTGAAGGVDRLLAARPVRYLGDISYALYLWHWPVLVLWLVTRGQQAVGLRGGAAIVLVSLVLAVVTHHLVERPTLRLPDRGGRRLAAGATAGVLAVTGVWGVVTFAQAGTGVATDETHPGARALLAGAVDPAPLMPPPVTVLDDWVRIEHWDCSPMAGFPMDVCAQPLRPVAAPEPEPDAAKDPAEALDPPVAEPAKRIVVVGDSHAQQLSGALLPIAERNNWQLIAIIRGACPFSTVSETNPDDADCLAWNIAAADEISALHPDAVVTLASRNVRAGLTEQTPAGFVDQWRRLDGEGIPVLALRDNPRFDASMPDCVLLHPDDPGACATDRAALYASVPPWTEIPDLPANVAFVDIADAVCDAERCPPVIGNVLVYMDDNHVTATYGSSMADLIADQVHAGLGW